MSATTLAAGGRVGCSSAVDEVVVGVRRSGWNGANVCFLTCPILVFKPRARGIVAVPLQAVRAPRPRAERASPKWLYRRVRI